MKNLPHKSNEKTGADHLHDSLMDQMREHVQLMELEKSQVPMVYALRDKPLPTMSQFAELARHLKEETTRLLGISGTFLSPHIAIKWSWWMPQNKIVAMTKNSLTTITMHPYHVSKYFFDMWGVNPKTLSDLCGIYKDLLANNTEARVDSALSKINRRYDEAMRKLAL